MAWHLFWTGHTVADLLGNVALGESDDVGSRAGTGKPGKLAALTVQDQGRNALDAGTGRTRVPNSPPAPAGRPPA